MCLLVKSHLEGNTINRLTVVNSGQFAQVGGEKGNLTVYFHIVTLS